MSENKRFIEDVFHSALGLPYAVLIIGSSGVLCGLVLRQLWHWFVAPTFGLPELSIPIAIGLMLVASMFLPRRELRKRIEVRIFLARLYGRPLLALAYGWLVSLFI